MTIRWETDKIFTKNACGRIDVKATTSLRVQERFSFKASRFEGPSERFSTDKRCEAPWAHYL